LRRSNVSAIIGLPGAALVEERPVMLGMNSWLHWVILLIVVVILFGGRGKISSIAGDLGKGINAFKKNLKSSSEENKDEAQRALDANPIAGERVKKDEAAKG
jgi:sec-independent protein translocase protein TatA